MKNSVIIEDVQLSYTITGSGTESLLVFHGFAQDLSRYHDFMKLFGNHYRLYLIDLFFHGDSIWPGGTHYLTTEFWNQLLQKIVSENHIGHFSLLGISMGARFALTAIPQFKNQIDQVWLIAPDGIYNNLWFKVATSSSLQRSVFYFLMKHPGPLKILINVLRKLKLISKGLFHWTNHYLNSDHRRQKIVKGWTCFRTLPPNHDWLKCMSEMNIPLKVFLGSRDEVIKKEKIQNKLKSVKTADIKILEANHNNIFSITVRFLRNTQFDNQS